jgi:hypothetical protein
MPAPANAGIGSFQIALLYHIRAENAAMPGAREGIFRLCESGKGNSKRTDQLQR